MGITERGKLIISKIQLYLDDIGKKVFDWCVDKFGEKTAHSLKRIFFSKEVIELYKPQWIGDPNVGTDDFTGKVSLSNTVLWTTVIRGFSWPCLFFGPLWFFQKYGIPIYWSLIVLIAAIFTYGISWVVLPFFANKFHEKKMRKTGFCNRKEIEELMSHLLKRPWHLKGP